MRHALALFAVVVAALAASTSPARAQVRAVPPFFGQSGVAFDPEISIVESGAKLDAQATVSADRKYVTLTMRPQLASLVALREFTFQNGGARGIVGLPQTGTQGLANAAPAPANANKAPAPAAAVPAPPKPAQPSVLEREGMFRVVLQADAGAR